MANNGFSLVFEERGFREVEQVFKHLSSNDKSKLLHGMGNAALTNTLLNFDREQTPDGDKWEISQRAANQGGKTLQDDGHLRDSYTYQVEGDSVAVGSNHFSARIHHFGGKITPKKAKVLAFQVGGKWVFAQSVTMPARPALGVNDELSEDIRDLTTVWMGVA